MRRDRRQDLLLTAVMVGIVLTPGWLLPAPWSMGWLVVTGGLAGPALWWSWSHAPWQPTPDGEWPRVVAALALQPGERFCDLGAGDGRMVLAVRRLTGADCTGIEAAPGMFVMGWLRLALQGDAATRMRFGDLYRADLAPYDVLYVWGTAYSVSQPRFGALAAAATARGARVVSYHHAIHGLQPTRTDDAGQRPLYVYEP